MKSYFRTTIKVAQRAMYLLVAIYLLGLLCGSAVSAQQAEDFNAIYGDYAMFQDNACNISSNSTNTAVTNINGLRDQIAQMLFVRVNSAQEASDAITTNHVGGVYISQWLDKTAIQTAKTSYTPNAFVGIDEEGGKVHRLSNEGTMPSAAEMGAMSDDQVKQVADEWAKKMLTYGVNVDFAPVVDLNNPSSPIIGANGRSFSSDPNVVAAKANAFADGLRQNGIIPTFKHFPGHGNSLQDSHLGDATTPPLDSLKKADLVPYTKVLSNPESMVMMGHLVVPGLTTAEEPASINKAAYDLLRNDYKFSGLTITDDLGDMKAIKDHYSLPEAVNKSFLAGADIALFNGESQVKAIIDYVEQQANTNPDLKAKIAASSAKIVAQKATLKNPASTADSNSTSTGNCTCGGAATILAGNDNAEKIWNFFAAKQVKPEIIAGIMGNMQAESGFEPRLVQYGALNSRGEVSAPNSPTRLDDTPPQGAQTGYGIVQFTPATKIIPFAQKANKPPGDLGFQLQLLWDQLTGNAEGLNEKPAGDAVFATTTVDDATTKFLKLYERAGVERLDVRLGFAHDIFAKYGSGTPSGSAPTSNSTSVTTSSGGCGGGTAQGATGGVLAWPEPPDSTISQCYTFNTTTRQGHPGMDIFGKQGEKTPIFAAADGTVTYAGGPDGGYGPYFVVITHNEKLSTGYGHMSSMIVKVGDKVKQGQQIGTEGNLGRSFGPHLHFNVYPAPNMTGDGNNVDPLANGLTIPGTVKNTPGCH